MGKVYIEKYNFQDVESVENQFNSLLNQELDSVQALEGWLKDVSAFYDSLEEALSGHYIDFQAYNNDPDAKQKHEYDQEKIEPLVKRYQEKLDKKVMNSPYKDVLNQEEYGRFLRSKENALELFNEENVQLEVEEGKLANQYFEITGGLTADWNGEEKTIVQLYPFLEDPDREIRKKAYDLISESFLSVKNELQPIMSKLIAIRDKKASNSNLPNYRDYMFKKYERFDYTPEDCKELAESIQIHVLPVLEQLQYQHRDEIGLEELKPYDTSAVPRTKKPLRPFHSTQEWVDKTSTVLDKLDPRFAELINIMNEKGMLDLESRKNKSPGGFCTPLPISELSFIFMNASSTHSDMLTLFHEMGHCIHNDFKKDIDLSYYRETPMESAELASMSMELLTMDHWHHFYSEEELKRAKLDVLKDIVKFLPQGIKIDQFQHWMYENPNHTDKDRMEKYLEISNQFEPGVINWDGYDEFKAASWLRVLHIFEVPFYYIEYVIAQLGALQMYKQYKENPEKTLSNYKKALSLGNKKSLSEVYETAGIKFDFSASMVKELMDFVMEEIASLEQASV